MSVLEMPEALDKGQSLPSVLFRQKWHLSSSQDISFDNLTNIAAESLDMPVAMVNLVSEHWLMVKSSVGLAAHKVALDQSLCGKVAHRDELMLWSDIDFPTDWCAISSDNQGKGNFQFYAGAPIHDIDGSVLGTLCVMDFVPREMHDAHKKLLTGLAGQLENLVKMDRLNQSLKQELAQSESYRNQLEDLLGAIDLASDGIAILGPDENYRYLNKAHVELFGFEHEEDLLGKSWRTLYSAEKVSEFESKAFPKLGETGCWSGEAVARRQDGSEFHEEISLTALRGGGLVCICRDVSVRVNQQQQILKAKQTADRASKIKSEFIANVSHELRTPLNGIVGLIYLLKRLPLDDKALEYIEMADTSANALLCLISDLLDFSKIEAGKMEYKIEPVPLAEVLEESFNSVLPLATEKKLPIIIKNEIPETILNTDRNRLAQILKNLLSNAVKFTDEGQVQLQANLEAGQIVLSVVDSGCGISEDLKSQIFEPFTQDNTLSMSTGGTGLGLSICNRLAEGLGGTLKFESKPGLGTQFNLCLPVNP